ncbi:MarR family transcriptional regulator [Streptomyces sp. NPDC050704]|uniref:MarR family winged helix-turn-helix transcriptional regulator n=1 Tax=Streptomyces sp. NPDC050704 TaxID=3157219 RepID=UPI0034379F02
MSPTPEDRELTDTLAGLSTQLEGIKATESRRLGLTPQQAQLLCVIEPGERTHGELAALLHCDKTNITGLVGRLERRGLVRRQTAPKDRRATHVILTDEGAALMTRFRDAVTTTVTELFTTWPPADRAALTRLAHTATHLLTHTPTTT